MLRLIIRQIWNQRKQNVWIFLELVIAGVFLWAILDPLCLNYADLSIPNGWDDKGVYKVEIRKYSELNVRYDASIDSANLCYDHYRQIYTTLSAQPEIADYAFVWDYPNSGNNISELALKDNVELSKAKKVERPVVNYAYQEAESDMFKVFGFRDVSTGEILSIRKDAAAKKLVYVSEDLALSLYGKIDVVGERICTGDIDDRRTYEIGGVFKPYKFRNMLQPIKHVIHVANGLQSTKQKVYLTNLFVKLKDGVDEKAFLQRFKKEVMPMLKVGNFYCSDINSFEAMNHEFNEQFGFYNEFRMNIIFVIFGVLCVFLGMVGTFWIRVDERRQEIGVMRSIGASRNKIVRQFMTETACLVTMAFLLVMGIVAIYVYKEGFFATVWLKNLVLKCWQNNDYLHFAVISLVTYVVLLVTSLIGTAIPVVKASQELPADALRDE